MKISRLYSNKADIFEPIQFVDGLNVFIAEIRLPENRNKDTHNLGKTTVGRILDFCFLAKKDPGFFLFKHQEIFNEFVFFLEIMLGDNEYITVRRAVADATKICIKMHLANNQDFSILPISDWDHQSLPFQRARELLDGLLDWRALRPWSFRNGLGYLLRTQDDFRDVFHLKKFSGAHSDWKPFLAHLLGFDSKLIKQHYQNEVLLDKKKSLEQTIKSELGGSVSDISKIEGLLLLKQKDAEKKQKFIDTFDFRSLDTERTKKLVEDVNGRIAELNAIRYTLQQNKQRIRSSLVDDNILFDPDEAKRLFYEAGVLFDGQIKKDFRQLIEFNKAITDERTRYLNDELLGIDSRLSSINSEINLLGKERSRILSFLSDTDVFTKYKKISEEMVLLRADITSLERQRVSLHRLQELRSDIRALAGEGCNLQAQIEKDVECQDSDPNSLFSTIRIYFSEIVEEVIDRKALLSVSPNNLGHLEFKADILDESGIATSAGLGHTYRKLLCIAFDLALLRAYIGMKFPRFVYHDGVFESLDDRKKENLLSVIRRYASLGLQPIISLIDSDLPSRSAENNVFDDSEIVLILHDEDETGRLFKMKTW